MITGIAFAASLLMPQGTTSDEEMSPAPSVLQAEPSEVYRALLAAETNPTPGAAQTIAAGLASGHPEVTARAAWSAGKLQMREVIPQLIELSQAPTALPVRRQAIAALSAMPDPRSEEAALETLESEDLTARTFAARLLGQLKTSAAIAPLVKLLSKQGDGDDRVQAMLALSDIGDPQPLLAAACAISSNGSQLDHALAFAFQSLSNKLPPENECQTLLAVLDHPSTSVRRHAIARLGELRDPSSTQALEERLTEEDEHLLPLLQASLGSVQEQALRSSSPDPDGVSGGLSETRRKLAAGSFICLLLSIATFLLWRVNRRRRAQAWAAVAAQSQEHLSQDASLMEEPWTNPGSPSHTQEYLDPSAQGFRQETEAFHPTGRRSLRR